MPNGGCGVVSFGLKGGREAASVFMQNLELGAIETHVADARTCCLNPATSTHRQMTDEQLKEAGVPAELIRISLGLEDKEDLIAGRNAVIEALRAKKPIDKIFVLDGCQDGPIRTIVREAKKTDAILKFVDKERLNQLTNEHHQGLLQLSQHMNMERLRICLKEQKKG